ncbi:MAG: PD-(D/E)XK nuclease family protein, partial [Candidatus Sericytochromatia bacterium]
MHNYFQRKVHYEAKRVLIDNTSKIELEYLKAYSYFVYFNSKYEYIKSLIPKKSFMRDLTTSLLKIFEYLKIDQNYINDEKEEVTYKLPYIRFKEVLENIVKSVEKIDNRKYELLEFIDIFLKLGQSRFVTKEKYNYGVFVTELPFLSKMNFKRIYQVGMTNKYFPTASSKSIFHKFISKFKPIETRDTQLFNFTEILNKSNIKEDFELRLCYPLVLQNEEDESSEVFLDIIPYFPKEKQKFIPKPYNQEEVIYSNTEKALAVAKNLYQIDEKISLLDHIEKREDIYNWSEYEGYLNEKNSNILKKHTSITKIEEYSNCHMKYWFDVELGLKASKKVAKDLDSSLKGTLIHKILEDYYTQSVKKDLFISSTEGLLCLESRTLMLEIANNEFKTYEESLNNIYIDKIKEIVISGLDDLESKRKGILLQILELDQERIVTDQIPSKFEYNFYCEIEGLKFKGIIDRVDEYTDNEHFDVLDYKTGEIKANDKSSEILEGLSFQLPIYSIAYGKESNKKIKEGSYYSLKQNSFKDEISLQVAL